MAAERELASPPTISEVATAAGVARATAARTLGGYGNVSPEVRERVLAAAAELGYRTNALARSMSTGVSHTLGVIVADIGNPFFAGVVRAISDRLRERGFDTIVVSTGEDLAEEIAAMNVLIDKRVDGVIVASAAIERADVAHLTAAINHCIPVVLVDREVSPLDLDAVVIDNRAAAREAVDLLARAGHTRIGLIWGPSTDTRPPTRPELLAAAGKDLWTDAERLRGYLDALDHAGIRFDPDLVMVGEKTEAGATDEVARMLALPYRATAILCTETNAMTGALRAVRAAGLSYPADVSLIGFDDSSWAAVMDPPLTMIKQPMHALGTRAAEILLALIDGEITPRSRHTLETRLVSRESVAPPRTRRFHRELEPPGVA